MSTKKYSFGKWQSLTTWPIFELVFQLVDQRPNYLKWFADFHGRRDVRQVQGVNLEGAHGPEGAVKYSRPCNLSLDDALPCDSKKMLLDRNALLYTITCINFT